MESLMHSSSNHMSNGDMPARSYYTVVGMHRFSTSPIDRSTTWVSVTCVRRVECKCCACAYLHQIQLGRPFHFYLSDYLSAHPPTLQLALGPTHVQCVLPAAVETWPTCRYLSCSGSLHGTSLRSRPAESIWPTLHSLRDWTFTLSKGHGSHAAGKGAFSAEPDAQNVTKFTLHAALAVVYM